MLGSSWTGIVVKWIMLLGVDGEEDSRWYKETDAALVAIANRV